LPGKKSEHPYHKRKIPELVQMSPNTQKSFQTGIQISLSDKTAKAQIVQMNPKWSESLQLAQKMERKVSGEPTMEH
jgi:hypothetical protein